MLAATLAGQDRQGTRSNAPGADAAEDRDSGVAVRMFESPTLDRFLRKAQDFLGRDDHAGAIKVLQDVLTGEIHGDSGSPEEPDGEPEPGDDPRNAVFSSDGRLYRPVRRLCQEFLATLPETGLSLYRQMYEVAAERAYSEAIARRDVRGLEEVYNRYFVTLAAGRAMLAAGELLMHEGRVRAAIQTFRTLMGTYPEESRAAAGLSTVYLRIKLALCFSQIGELAQARAMLDELVAEDPETTVRVLGELVTVADLARSDLFSEVAGTPLARLESGHSAVVRSLEDGLIPVWQYRYTDSEPYRRPLSSSNSRFTIARGPAPASPWYHRHKPGTSILFDRDRLAFMDHFRLRVHDLGSGLVNLQTLEPDRPPKPRQGKARVRIPVYDWAAMRVEAGPDAYFCVVGPGGRSSLPNLEPILRNRVVAYHRDTLEPKWSTSEWKRGEKSYDGVTFLSTPTLFGDRLLVPVLLGGGYALQGMSARDGEPLFRVMLHFGGSELARAVSPPVVVRAGTAYVLTNSGTVASVDALTGDLNWIRRYERLHPLRPGKPRRAPKKSSNQFSRQYFRHVSLNGFVPSDVIAVEGRIVIAPSDGEAMVCVDGASGELLWALTKPSGDSVYVVGSNDRYLFVAGWLAWGGVHRPDAQIGCIELATGVRLWETKMPESAWDGRGLVTDERVVIPGKRAVYSMPVDGNGTWRRTPLPPFSVGQNPLAGEMNLFADGPYLVACYAGGIEVFASLEALRELAQESSDPLERAGLLVQAGDLVTAIGVLEPLCLDESAPLETRKKLTRRALALVRDVVLQRGPESTLEDSLALLGRARTWVESRDLLLQWQLLKVEMYQALGDRDAVDREQDALYEMMEGKRQ